MEVDILFDERVELNAMTSEKARIQPVPKLFQFAHAI
jgi:hypothetical protein